MTDQKFVAVKAKAFFDSLWKRGDPWNLETSKFEEEKYARQIAMLKGGRYAQALEIGCGAGYFTRLLARISDRVVALDISPNAIMQAGNRGTDPSIVDFRVQNIMDYDVHADGPWNLIVMSETIYYLGWLYPFFDVAWLGAELFAATSDNGRLVMANTCGGVEDYLLLPWIIRTYRDLFLNVGYCLEAEEIFHGTKEGVELEVLISLFKKNSKKTTALAGPETPL